MTIRAYFCLVFLCWSLPVACQEVGFLDLTQSTVRESTRHPRTLGDSCAGAENAQIQRQVLVTLVSLDHAVYRLNDELTFEALLQNTGKKRVVIPWTPHAHDVEPSEENVSFSCRVAALILTFEDPQRRTATLAASMYGTHRVTGTLKSISPGESVRIRARVRFHPLDPGWSQEELADREPFVAKISGSFREDIRTFKADNGGSMNDSCTDIHSLAGNSKEITVEPR